MGNLRVSNETILAKIEVTYNTDPVPVVGTNAILVMNPAFSAEGLRMNERPSIRASLGDVQAVFGGRLARLNFDVEAKGSGTAGTAPELGPLLRGCAMGETLVAVTSATYKPISTTHESLTFYYYEGGRKLHKITGARGTFSFKVTAGGLGMFTFSFVGHYTEPTDIAQPVPVYNATVPKAALSMAIAVGGVNVVTREWSVDVANTIAMPPSLAAADGYSEIQITNRNVAGSMTIESELASVIDVDTQLKAGTGSTFGSGTLGSVAGNRLVVSSATSGLYWKGVSLSDGDGLRLRTMAFGLVESASLNDEMAIAWT